MIQTLSFKKLQDTYKRKISDSQSAQILKQLPYFDDFVIRLKMQNFIIII